MPRSVEDDPAQGDSRPAPYTLCEPPSPSTSVPRRPVSSIPAPVASALTLPPGSQAVPPSQAGDRAGGPEGWREWPAGTGAWFNSEQKVGPSHLFCLLLFVWRGLLALSLWPPTCGSNLSSGVWRLRKQLLPTAPMALEGQLRASWEEVVRQAPRQRHHTLDCRSESFGGGRGLEMSAALEQARALDLEARGAKFDLRGIPESQWPPIER